MNGELLGILAGVLLTFGTGVFVASEFALVNLDRAELEERQARGEKRLGITIRALKITSTHLSSAQLGITLTTLLAGYTFEPAISALLAAPLTSIGVPGAVLAGVSAVISVIIATLFSMIFGELIPKNFALAVPLATAKAMVPLQAAFTWLLKPIILMLNGTANRVIRSMGIEPKEEISGARTAEELSFLVQRSALEGSLDAEDAEFLHRTLSFAGRTAEEVMTPRVAAVTLDRDNSASDVIAAARESGFSRFPVLGEDIDDVVGVVHVKAAFATDVAARHTTLITELMQPVTKVPDTVGVDSLLVTLRERGNQMAIVIDEYGGTAGLVTLEDLVEELLGDVRDEHDVPTNEIVTFADSLVLAGTLRPDELWERAGVRVPDRESYETVAGFIFETLGHVPQRGESIKLEHGTLYVEELDGPRIITLRYVSSDTATDPAFSGSRERLLEQFVSEGQK